MLIFLFCSSFALRHLVAEGTLTPNLFPKGPTYGIMCAHVQKISSLPSQPMYKTRINYMNLPTHTRPVYKWRVWRLHQAIIPFPWISYISEWQIDKNLAPQGWWGDPLSLSDRHFSSQEGVKWADPAYEWIKTSFSKGSQVTDRQQRGGKGEVERAQCSASLCTNITTRHSSAVPFPLNSTQH